MAISAMVAITKAVSGKKGYAGTLNGRGISGSVLRSLNSEKQENIYRQMAPNTDRVIMSPVLPVNKAIMPINILNTNAQCGV